MTPSDQPACRIATRSSAEMAPPAAAWRAISANCMVMRERLPRIRPGYRAASLNWSYPALAPTCGDAGGAIDFPSIARAACLDVSRDRFGALLLRIEEDVDHSGLAGEMQLAHVAFAHIEARRAEAAHEARCVVLDHGLEPRQAHDLGCARVG